MVACRAGRPQNRGDPRKRLLLSQDQERAMKIVIHYCVS